jgi:ribonuclease HII
MAPMNARFAFDLERLRRAGSRHLIVGGADEAGRGCLAGPLVAAAVAFDYADWDEARFGLFERLNDSKRLAERRREVLFAEIVRYARQIVVVSCAAGSIDRRGLHVCNLRALAQALEGLRPAPALAFVDGFRLSNCRLPHEALVGGDGLSAAVAAASIVAKVTRDRLMHALAVEYPLWGFDQHVGYATRRHEAAICAHGVCNLHRLSFRSAAYEQLGLAPALPQAPGLPQASAGL